MTAQKHVRVRERKLKKRAVALGRTTKAKGGSLKQSAELMNLEAGTLRDWNRDWQTTRLPLEPRGRPPVRANSETKEAVECVIHSLGPQVGVPRLEAFFPQVPRREIEHLLACYREAHTDGDITYADVLHWQQPGTVWAMDYTDPPAPVDGKYRDILVVRDLASGTELSALPVPIEKAVHTAAALESLFIQHGPPLVMKRDNGGTLSAPPVASLLRKYGVSLLPSPVEMPQYNGSCEAGNGGLKTTTHHVASRNGRPGHWTCDDIEEGRQLNNSTHRPYGPKGPAPLMMWAQRDRISAKERRAFLREVAKRRSESLRLEEETITKSQKEATQTGMDAKQKRRHADTHQRDAVRKTLVSRGYLEYRKRVTST